MQTETITALEVFEQGLTKTAIKEMAANAVASVLEQGNPLQVAEALTAMENFIKEVKETKEFKEYVREETSKYGKGYVSPSGAKIEIAEVGSSYDFSQCNDGLLGELEQKLLSAKNAVDERKAFLKNVPQSGLIVTDEQSGDTYTVYKPAKTSQSSYKVTLHK